MTTISTLDITTAYWIDDVIAIPKGPYSHGVVLPATADVVRDFFSAEPNWSNWAGGEFYDESLVYGGVVMYRPMDGGDVKSDDWEHVIDLLGYLHIETYPVPWGQCGPQWRWLARDTSGETTVLESTHYEDALAEASDWIRCGDWTGDGSEEYHNQIIVIEIMRGLATGNNVEYVDWSGYGAYGSVDVLVNRVDAECSEDEHEMIDISIPTRPAITSACRHCGAWLDEFVGDGEVVRDCIAETTRVVGMIRAEAAYEQAEGKWSGADWTHAQRPIEYDSDGVPIICDGGDCDLCRTATADAEAAEQLAAEAVGYLRAGGYEQALASMEQAEGHESEYGDSPTWGPLLGIVRDIAASHA